MAKEMSPLGAFIASRRTEMKITQKEVCTRTNVDAGLLSKLSRGIGRPSMETLFRLAAGLEVDPVELFRISNSMTMWEVAERALQFRHDNSHTS